MVVGRKEEGTRLNHAVFPPLRDGEGGPWNPNTANVKARRNLYVQEVTGDQNVDDMISQSGPVELRESSSERFKQY